MIRVKSILPLIFAYVIMSCGPDSAMETECAYSESEIASLEISASGGDRTALRELDICYGLSNRKTDRDRIHRKRLEVGDPEALDEEAMRLVIVAEHEKDCLIRIYKLYNARDIAVISAKKERINEENSQIVKLIDKKISDNIC